MKYSNCFCKQQAEDVSQSLGLWYNKKHKFAPWFLQQAILRQATETYLYGRKVALLCKKQAKGFCKMTNFLFTFVRKIKEYCKKMNGRTTEK